MRVCFSDGWKGEPFYTVEALSKDDALILLYVGTIQEGAAMLTEAEAEAKKAMEAYEATEEIKEPKKSTAERVAEDIADFEQSEHGKQFLRVLEKAGELAEKHTTGNVFSLSEWRYLTEKALCTGFTDSVWTSVLQSYNLGYYRGFNYCKRKGGR